MTSKLSSSTSRWLETVPVDSFEKTNFNWQVQQLQQQVGEWLELTFNNTVVNNLAVSLPPWLIQVVLWLILGLFLSWLWWYLFRHIRPYLNFWKPPVRKLASRSAQGQPAELSVADWLQRSQELQKQGNYREACQSLYMALLQRLNHTHIAPQQASRTNGEYLQLVQNLPQAQPYQILITTHEQLCFGSAVITPATFKRCQQAYQDIEAI